MKSLYHSLRSKHSGLSRQKQILLPAIAVLLLVGGSWMASSEALAIYQRNQLDQDGGYSDVDYGDVPRNRINRETQPPANTPTVPVTAQFVNGSGNAAGRNVFSSQLHTTLWYAWNRGLGSLYPSSDSQMSGWVAALSEPNVSIGYDYGVYDAANPSQIIDKGSTVASGKQVILKFKPYVSDNIFWFGTGYSMDSPYGEWRAGAAAPPRSANQVQCLDKDLTAKYTVGDMTFDVYIPFVVNPPERTLGNTSGMSCGALSQNSDGSMSATCTITGSGTVSPTFNYGDTYGKFYYRYYDYRDMNSIGWGSAGCYGNNIPMTSSFGSATGPTTNSVTTAQSAYSVGIPQQSFSWPLTVGPSNNRPPVTPSVTCSASVQTGQDATVTVSATDPDDNQVQYGVDWIDDSTQEVNSGWTALAPSGTPGTLTKSGGFSTPGTYTVYAWSRDQNQVQSDTPASCTITVTSGAAPDLTAGSVTPTSASAGSAVTLSATIANSGNAPTGAPFTDVFQIASDGSGTNATDIGTFRSGIPNGFPANYSEPNASVSYTFQTGGTYYARACADKSSGGDSGAIAESNEGNNCGPWTQISVSGNTSYTCTVSQSSISVGDSVTYTAHIGTGALQNYTWTSSDNVGSYGSGSTANRTFNTPGSYGMTVDRMVGFNGATASCPVVTVGQTCTAPTLTLTGTPARIKPGSTTAVTYSATGVTSCTLTGPGAPAVTANACTLPQGSFTTPALTTQTIYKLTCDGVVKTLVINVLPNIIEF